MSDLVVAYIAAHSLDMTQTTTVLSSCPADVRLIASGWAGPVV